MRNPLKRHPSTEPKSSLRERLAATKAKAAGLGSGAVDDAGAAEPTDPIFAIIAAAREAEHYANGNIPGEEALAGTPEDKAEARERDRRTTLADKAHRAVFGIRPTTYAGFMALLDFAIEQQEVWQEWSNGPDVLGAIHASAAVLMSPKTSAEAVPDAGAFALQKAAGIDLSGLSIGQLGTLYERFNAVANVWGAELHLPYANEGETHFRVTTAAGDVIEREEERAGKIQDRIAAEIDRRQPADRWDANAQLETLVRHELMCNGDLRDPAIRARIETTWGDAPALDATTESVVRQTQPKAPVFATKVEAELMALAAQPDLSIIPTAGLAGTLNDLPPRYDLSACTLGQLAHLYEKWEGVCSHLNGTSETACFTDDSQNCFKPAGLILDREYGRASAFLVVIAQEARKRTPGDQSEKRARASLLTRNFLNGDTDGKDVTFLADLAATVGLEL